MSDYAAYRAAGQSVAALWHGVTIKRAGMKGVVVIWPELSGRMHVIADVAIWLTGVAAVDGYRFGRSCSYGRHTYWRLNDDQRSDLMQAGRLAELIDPTGSDDVLFGLWRLSLAFMVEHWAAIESVATAVQERHRLTGEEVEQLAAGRFWQTAVTGE